MLIAAIEIDNKINISMLSNYSIELFAMRKF